MPLFGSNGKRKTAVIDEALLHYVRRAKVIEPYVPAIFVWTYMAAEGAAFLAKELLVEMKDSPFRRADLDDTIARRFIAVGVAHMLALFLAGNENNRAWVADIMSDPAWSVNRSPYKGQTFDQIVCSFLEPIGSSYYTRFSTFYRLDADASEGMSPRLFGLGRTLEVAAFTNHDATYLTLEEFWEEGQIVLDKVADPRQATGIVRVASSVYQQFVEGLSQELEKTFPDSPKPE